MASTDTDDVQQVEIGTRMKEKQIPVGENELHPDILSIVRIVVSVLQQLIQICVYGARHFLKDQGLVIDRLIEVSSGFLTVYVKQFYDKILLDNNLRLSGDTEVSGFFINRPGETVKLIVHKISIKRDFNLMVLVKTQLFTFTSTNVFEMWIGRFLETSNQVLSI